MQNKHGQVKEIKMNLLNFFDTGSTAWAMSPVTGVAMIIIGYVVFIFST